MIDAASSLSSNRSGMKSPALDGCFFGTMICSVSCTKSEGIETSQAERSRYPRVHVALSQSPILLIYIAQRFIYGIFANC